VLRGLPVVLILCCPAGLTLGTALRGAGRDAGDGDHGCDRGDHRAL